MREVSSLIQSYLEGRLTVEEAEQLQTLLESDPAVGEQLLQHFEMDAMLRATKPISRAGLHRQPGLVPRRRFTLSTVSMVAAAAACVALAAGWAVTWMLPESTPAEELTASVAVLTTGVNLEWESAPVAPGTPLSPGWLRLKSGIAQIEFYRGARVRIEGPAELELVSAGEANCTRGKLSAHVPPQAKGFRINTPKGTIVDLGTDFALDLSEDDAAVHVFKGEVELHQAERAMQSLTEGQAMRLSDNAEREVADPAGFSTLQDLELQRLLSQRSALERWQVASARLNGDVGLRVHFDFQEPEGARSLVNRALAAAGVDDGSVVGASWTEGRWPGKRALEFRSVSDRVRLMVPGETAALTLSMWVRVNGLERAFNSLFMSEGWGERRVHWQITKDGRVRLGVASGAEKRHVDYDTPVWFTPERLGIWTHLAVVFDPENGEVRHYANGERIAVAAIKEATPLKIGIAELGNWSEPTKKVAGTAIRSLSGAIDEFALWDRPLGDADVAGLILR